MRGEVWGLFWEGCGHRNFGLSNMLGAACDFGGRWSPDHVDFSGNVQTRRMGKGLESFFC